MVKISFRSSVVAFQYCVPSEKSSGMYDSVLHSVSFSFHCRPTWDRRSWGIKTLRKFPGFENVRYRLKVAKMFLIRCDTMPYRCLWWLRSQSIDSTQNIDTWVLNWYFRSSKMKIIKKHTAISHRVKVTPSKIQSKCLFWSCIHWIWCTLTYVPGIPQFLRVSMRPHTGFRHFKANAFLSALLIM